MILIVHISKHLFLRLKPIFTKGRGTCTGRETLSKTNDVMINLDKHASKEIVSAYLLFNEICVCFFFSEFVALFTKKNL